MAKRKTVDWTAIVKNGEPLWRVALRLYGLQRNWKLVAFGISQFIGKSVTAATARKQCLLHACPDDLPLTGISRRETTILFEKFLKEHGIEIAEWFEFVGNEGM